MTEQGHLIYFRRYDTMIVLINRNIRQHPLRIMTHRGKRI